jgi:vitamin B12 transporter
LRLRARQKKGSREAAKGALLLVALPIPAIAQETIVPPTQEIVIADRIRSDLIVVTANGSPTRLWEVGRSITVIEDVASRPFVTVPDLLATTPGISVSRNGGIGGFSAVRIRGAEGEQTLTLIDGVRVNDPSSPGGGFDFGNLLTGTIERVEVLRGPNSVPWGSQAIGGVVNIVTVRPADDFGGSVRAEAGYQDAAAIAGNIGGTVGIVSASLGGGYFRDDGISAFKDGAERDGYRQYAANGKIGLALSNTLDLDFRAYYADSRTNIDGFPPPFFSFADTPELSTAQELYAYAGANLRWLDGKWRSRLAFTLSDINRDNFDAPGQVVPSFLARGRTERFEYQGDADISGGVRAVFGGEHEQSRFTDGFSPVKTNVTSGYAQLVVDPYDSLTLTGGARIDDHKTYGSETTFSTNLAWRPSGNTVIRAAYGEGFKAPTLFQLYSFFGNTTLQPEQAKSFEVGVEQKLIDDTLTLGVTLFQRNSRNQIDFISCLGQTTGICTNRPFGTYDNVKRSRAKGVETTLAIKPTDAFTIQANYTYVDAEDSTTGLTLLRRPKHSLNLDMDWRAREWLRVGASMRVVSDSADSDFQTFTRTSLDGYTLFGLRASVPIGESFEIFGRVDNLFDVSYDTVSGYGTYGRNAHFGVRALF